MQWQAVDVDTPLSALLGPYAVVALGPDDRRTTVLVEVLRHRRGRVTARICDTTMHTPPLGARRLRAPGTVTLRELVLAHTSCRAEAAAVSPPQKWTGTSDPTLTPWMMAVGAVLAIGGMAIAQVAFAIPGLTLLILGAMQSRHTQDGTARIVDGGRDILPTAARSYIPAPAALTAGPTPAERVAVVRDAYGRLLADIVYRIENSALFDAAVPETAEFQLALALWDEESPRADELARAIETSFDAARTKAEALGIAHLPETAQGPARRAAKAAETALADGPAPEREAARRWVAEILGSLALYYLPPVDPAAPSLIGARRQIEPAP
ncbi:MAG: hypothetical protein IPJ61_00755 [Tessaracoccus sp.]|uniref:hypothetical protein n=1 Tax=Tessaracoccus sp. TaxID=1971211 RepID=UPI001ECC49D9|nr:hypothetical protein [Tessaracoccus sp.]MBK7819626.1 hypothetical protein [Tessaracoccus sp.]